MKKIVLGSQLFGSDLNEKKSFFILDCAYENELYKIVGREGDVINVGGLKFMSSEVERIALEFPNISLVKAYPKNNPISGQHVEIIVQSVDNALLDKIEFKKFMKKKLPTHMVPKRYSFEKIDIGHRYKKK